MYLSWLLLKIVNNNESLAFRDMVDQLNLHVRALNALNVSTDKYELFLTEILLITINKKLRVSFAKLSDESQTLDGLVN